MNRLALGLALAASVALASSCRTPGETPSGPPGPFEDVPTGPELRVLVIGDWGTGGSDQQAIATRIALIHKGFPPHLVLTVGDNFYPDGVDSVEDPLWEEVFGGVYTGGFWDSVTFRPSLGNHDYLGDPSAQIAYSELDPRWDMPDFFYAFREPTPDGGTVQFLALDTDVMAEGRDLMGEPAWIDSVAGAARAEGVDWLIAYGHHPVATAGRYRPEDEVVRYLRPAIERHRLLYLAGHNHSTELLELGPGLFQGVCGGTGGRDNDYPVYRAEDVRAAFTSGGWCMLRIWKDVLAIELHDRFGRLRHREVLRKGPAGPG